MTTQRPAQQETAGPGPWATGHELFLRAQIKTRPGAADNNGDRWADNAYTGLVLASCNCGYTSGWVPRATLPTDLRSEHPSPHALPSIVPLVETARSVEADQPSSET